MAQQLAHFQTQQDHISLIVDEYGEIMGMITLEDILEEIIGKFSDATPDEPAPVPQPDGSYLVEGTTAIRDLNRRMNWQLPTEGPSTLSGLIIEHLEFIPSHPVCCRIAGIPLEVMHIKNNKINTVRVMPQLSKPTERPLPGPMRTKGTAHETPEHPMDCHTLLSTVTPPCPWSWRWA